MPTPANNPIVQNRPGTLEVQLPAEIRPRPIIVTPIIAVYRDPNRCPSLDASTPNATPQHRFSDPIKETVEVGMSESVLLRSPDCRIPQQLIIPFIQNVTVKPATTTAHP
jgi:hypothetical protein